MRSAVYRILENPVVFWLSQRTLAPGAVPVIKRRIRRTLDALPPAERILDVGCGPESWLFRLGIQPVGLDVNRAYMKAYRKRAPEALVASAAQLPFDDGSFDGVWSLMLFHHLPDELVRCSTAELVRVCKPGGYVAIYDGVRPEIAWRRPTAAFLRDHDRGEFMRQHGDLEKLLPGACEWESDRWTYSLTGLEMGTWCAIKPSA